jgi:hypothetical protein
LISSQCKLGFLSKQKANIKNSIVNSYYTFVTPASSCFVRKLFSRAASLENNGFDER